MAASVRLSFNRLTTRYSETPLSHKLKPPIPRTARVRSLIVSRREGDRMEIDEETRAKRNSEKQAMKEAGLVKRKVGLHIGYVGTDYSGLQLSTVGDVKTIEAELQTALCKSGCVTESNSVSLSKVKWSRSSRTDKGVHSLATVVALKCIVDENKFDSDPEGLELAQHISSFLPPQIRVFSVQRVNDGFFARKACTSRCYSYYVPLSLITGSVDPVEAEVEKQRLELFKTALGMYCGRHAFHNYTKRKQYIENHDSWSFGRRSRHRRRLAQEGAVDEDDASEGDDMALTQADKSSDNARPDYEELVAREKETGRWRFWKFEFKELNDQSDRVVAPHYRHILSFAVDDPAPVVPDGVRAVCCTVKGYSFMLHQIRYMIGTAVAVARNLISLSVVESSLKACIRINLPLALPQPLVLIDNEFSEFPGNKGEPAVVAKWSGKQLELRQGGKMLQQEFREQVMLPEIDRLLRLPDWDKWSKVLNLVTYDETVHEDVHDVMKKYDAWVKEKQEIKQEKQQALQKELEERGIDRETWMKERKQKSRQNKRHPAKARW